MSKTRELHTASLIVGRKGTGKSTLLAGMAKSYAGDKVLILDVNNSPAYNEYKEITINQVKLLRQGVVKLCGTPTKETLNNIAKNFRNGLVVFEDCTKYISGNPDPEIKGFLVDHRMMGCDLIFTFHSFRSVPPFFWTMVSYVLILKTQEDFEIPRNRSLVPNYKEVLAAFNRVAVNSNNYYNETVPTFV